MALFPSIRQTFTRKLNRFFAKRAPRQDTATLNLGNIYIFFSKEGMLFPFLLIITFIAGINYGNNLVLGLCFYLASIWVISLHLTYAHISGLKFKFRETKFSEAGTPAWVSFDIINDKSKPSRQLTLTFDNASSHPISRQDSPSNILTEHGVAPSITLSRLQGTQTVSLPVAANKRGKLILPRLIVSTVYPLGIMRAWSYVYFATPVWVYPKPLPFEWIESHVTASDDDANISAHGQRGQNDFESLDEYVTGESLARVSWAHMARGQGMLTKQFADSVGHELCLDYADMPAAHHEDKLAQLSYAVIQAGKTGAAFQLNLPDDKGTIGQGSAFLQACLLRLAKAP